jgi:NAD(P)-dependent dehydrogenase (short-subunit alcohol dehydrogenase family)
MDTVAGQRPTVFVVGGSSGIGEAAAIRFAREGWRAIVAAPGMPSVEKVVRRLDGSGHMPINLDVTADDQIVAAADQVRSRFGVIQALVNSVGICEFHDSIESPFHAWDRHLQVMMYGSVKLCRLFVPLIADGGRIVHVTSIQHERVERGSSSYGMAKAALTQYTRSLALELAHRRIMVNAIAPGFVRTPMSIRPDGTNELETQWFKDNYVRYDHLPLKRAAEPNEIAGVIFFLAGPDASYVTGSVVTVDGGLTVTV